MTIMLTPDQQETMRATHEFIFTPEGEKWYHQPFWLKDLGSGKFEQIFYEQLPNSVKDFVLQQKGIK